MTITQLEYIVAVANSKSFVKAAEKCFVTQPTLSMQIQKLEDELSVKIFDRSKQPIVTTEIGEEIIQQARMVLSASKKVLEIASDASGKIIGQINFGIIPTLAPYFLPVFLDKFLTQYPDVELHVQELPTEEIVSRLKKGTIDCGLMATPFEDHSLTEFPMFYEPFVAYVSRKSALFAQKEIAAEDLNITETWILNEGHCLRNQVINLCKERSETPKLHFNYESGSLETLKRLVELDKGITILPILAIQGMTENQQELVRYFKKPEPVREISLVIHRQFLKRKMINAIMKTIQESIPLDLKVKEARKVVAI